MTTSLIVTFHVDFAMINNTTLDKFYQRFPLIKMVKLFNNGKIDYIQNQTHL